MADQDLHQQALLELCLGLYFSQEMIMDRRMA